MKIIEHCVKNPKNEQNKIEENTTPRSVKIREERTDGGLDKMEDEESLREERTAPS
jgi:hypothetical protein